MHLYQCYDSVSSEDLKTNTGKMDQAFDPNQPTTLLFKQIEDEQKFAPAAGVPFMHDQLVKKQNN
eukprot:11407423-Ditylum_brightwellii.AAC.1